MSALILLLLAVCLALLILEDRQVRRDRSELVHVVYVNGIRGKSTVTRMIDGGLRAGGWKVFCKTTGTVPMVIGVDGTAGLWSARGRANISEQVRVLHRAVREGAQILVIECMAVDPALQAVSQHRDGAGRTSESSPMSGWTTLRRWGPRWRRSATPSPTQSPGMGPCSRQTERSWTSFGPTDAEKRRVELAQPWTAACRTSIFLKM